MPRKIAFPTLVIFLFVCVCLPVTWWGYVNNRPLPLSAEETLFQGVAYQREVWSAPRNVVIHVITIDLHAQGIRTLVTPPSDPERDLPLDARTTSEFVDDFGVQIAINGDFFQPCSIITPTPAIRSSRSVTPRRRALFTRRPRAAPQRFFSLRSTTPGSTARWGRSTTLFRDFPF